ncbi:MAG: fumarylacetoacetate hydrolase family protein [Rhodothermales bacterium]|nr:fumarylacetoacetate hydrolase family protein [Rhodothermales bacterium]
MSELRIPYEGNEANGPGRTVRPGKLLCIGRNYARHAAEMGAETPSEPMVFLKPSSAVIRSGGAVVIPTLSTDVHHEVELVAVIGRSGRHIPADEALSYVAGYAAGLDMTARDIQGRAKREGAPWSVSKGFDTFAPLGDIMSASAVGDPQDLDVELRINGNVRQSGRTSDMIFPVADLISWCSRIFTLEPGDLIYTGTPEGVGPVHDGDRLTARVGMLPELTVSVETERR